VREIEQLEAWTRSIPLEEAGSRHLLNVEAHVPPHAILAVEVYAPDDLETPLLPALAVEGSLTRDLSSLHLLREGLEEVRLRLVASLGGPMDEQITVNTLTID
jgi:hypothetical protein